MDEQDIPYMMNALKQKSTELFQVTITYEAKFQRQNDIINQQNITISDLRNQIQNLSKTPTTPQRRKKSSGDGEF